MPNLSSRLSMAGLDPAIQQCRATADHPLSCVGAVARLDGRVKPGHGGLMGCIAAIVLLATPAVAQGVNDYPTSVRADYVFGCMKANGETRDALERCSCSIDVIATLLPYERYVSAETFMRMGQLQGEGGVLFRTSEQSHAAIGDLKRAQAEAEIRCF